METSAIIIEKIEEKDYAPLYSWLPGQLRAQDAFIEIDSSGLVRASYDPDINGGCRADIWKGETRRYALGGSAPLARPCAINWLLEALRPHLGRIHSDPLSADAQASEREIEQVIESWGEDLAEDDSHIWVYPSDDDGRII